MGHQACRGSEANPFALDTGSMAQGGGQMGFAGPRVANQEDILFLLDIFPTQEFAYQHFVEGGLGVEVESVDGF